MRRNASHAILSHVTTNSANIMRTSTVAIFTLLSFNLLGQETWNFENLNEKDLHTNSSTMTKCVTASSESDTSSDSCSDTDSESTSYQFDNYPTVTATATWSASATASAETSESFPDVTSPASWKYSYLNDNGNWVLKTHQHGVKLEDITVSHAQIVGYGKLQMESTAHLIEPYSDGNNCNSNLNCPNCNNSNV